VTTRRANEGGDLRACRELMRHLSHPRRLRDNRIVHSILKSRGHDGDQLSDESLVALINGALASALKGLSTRRLAIVRRCDIGGERYADVARSLAISERHAFRERDAALLSITAHLIPRLAIVEARAKPAVDALWFQVAHAQAMEHNGRWQEAAYVLERVGSDLSDPVGRSFIETRLARLYIGTERFSLAEHHLCVARELITRAGRARSWYHAEVDVAAARLADAIGDIRGGAQLARSACTELQSLAHTSTDRRVLNALIDALTLRAEGAYSQGDDATAASFARAACTATGEAPSLDPQVDISAREAAALVSHWPDRDRALAVCYSLATQAGLTRQAIVIAAHRAGFLRLGGHPREAIELLTPLAATARIVGVGEPLALFVYELAASNLESGALEAAASYLTEMQASAAGSPVKQGHAKFVAAKLHLARRKYALALDYAEGAESTFALMHTDRFLGVSLRLQAEALEALGQKERALKTIKRAIEVSAVGDQPATLGTAYRVLSRLSGDTKYAAMARHFRARAGLPPPP